jgi:hypothetical protein
MVNEETGQFAETAIIFYLEELKEVSAQTNDQIKYVCKHKAMRRVRLKKVLNPKVWRDASTYLKVEVEDIVDEDASVDYTEEEKELLKTFSDVIDLQDSVKEEPRFSMELKQMSVPTCTTYLSHAPPALPIPPMPLGPPNAVVSKRSHAFAAVRPSSDLIECTLWLCLLAHDRAPARCYRHVGQLRREEVRRRGALDNGKPVADFC